MARALRSFDPLRESRDRPQRAARRGKVCFGLAPQTGRAHRRVCGLACPNIVDGGVDPPAVTWTFTGRPSRRKGAATRLTSEVGAGVFVRQQWPHRDLPESIP
jgi:hypothetical protein